MGAECEPLSWLICLAGKWNEFKGGKRGVKKVMVVWLIDGQTTGMEWKQARKRENIVGNIQGDDMLMKLK